MSASNPGPMFMGLVAVLFSFGVAYIAHRGVNGSTGVNIAINIIQISALIVFSVMALGYRMNHPPGSVAWQFDSISGEAYTYEFATTSQNGQRDSNGCHHPRCQHGSAAQARRERKAGALPSSATPRMTRAIRRCFRPIPTPDPSSALHKWGWVFVQATVAILILVGFESCTALGGEAKNAKRDIPIAVITLTAGSGGVLLPVRVFRRKLLLK